MNAKYFFYFLNLGLSDLALSHITRCVSKDPLHGYFSQWICNACLFRLHEISDVLVQDTWDSNPYPYQRICTLIQHTKSIMNSNAIWNDPDRILSFLRILKCYLESYDWISWSTNEKDFITNSLREYIPIIRRKGLHVAFEVRKKCNIIILDFNN